MKNCLNVAKTILDLDKSSFISKVVNINKEKIVSAKEASITENHFLSHSDFKPTGYFLEKDVAYTFTFNGLPALGTKLVVGSQKDTWEIDWETPPNTKWGINKGFDEQDISNNSKEIMTLIFSEDGPLYIADSNMTKLEIIKITNTSNHKIMKMPTYKLNKTNQQQFVLEVKQTNLPFVELVGKHFFATMHTNIFIEFIDKLGDLNEILERWDFAWERYNWVHGLDENISGLHKKYPHYIQINSTRKMDVANANALSRNGHMIFLSGTFHDSLTGIFTDKLGIFWHELGHMYQTLSYVWSNELVEVTSEIPRTYIMEYLNLWDKESWIWLSGVYIKEFFAIPDNKRDYDELTVRRDFYVVLSMFWQLKMGFGKNFYPLLNKTYRELDNEFNKFEEFDLDERRRIKKQNFIKITSSVSGYNLIPFFEKWGIWPSQETKNIVSSYHLKSLTKNIWDNIVDESTKLNPIVQEELELN